MAEIMRRLLLGGLLVLASLSAGAQGQSPRADIPLGLDLHMPVRDENPLTADTVALGKRLFFDPILSRDRSLACVFLSRPGPSLHERPGGGGRPKEISEDGRTHRGCRSRTT